MYNIFHKDYHSVRSYANRLCEGIMDITWYIFDMIGTIAFAISGALVGVARRMDIFVWLYWHYGNRWWNCT